MPATQTPSVAQRRTTPIAAWRPIVFGMLAAMAIAAVVGLAVLNSQSPSTDDAPTGPHSGWLWIAGICALAALGTGVLGWRGAERRAYAAQARLETVSSTLGGLRDLLERREAQLGELRRQAGWIYWEQDSAGRYQVLETGTDAGLEHFRQLLGTARETGAQIDDVSQWHRVSSLIERRKPFRGLRWRRTHADGLSVDLEEHGRARHDALGRFIGYCGVIREQVAEPGEARTRFDLGVLAAVPLPVILLESRLGDWRLAWANAHASTLTGRNEIELGTIDIARWILPNTGNGSAQTTLGAMLDAREGQRFDAGILDRFGESTAASVVVACAEGPDHVPMRLLLLDTVSPECERLRLLAAGAERARREETARVLELAVTARELESFSHTVSHDLRSPLRVVDGFARILLEDFSTDIPPQAHEHLNRIVAAAGRMNEMIDALLGLARISSQPVIPEPVDMSALAHGIVDELRHRDPARRVEFEIGQRLQCRGDRVLLRVALENLLGNAWKYTAGQSVAHIVFDSVLIDGVTVYRVSDDGAGFDMCFSDQLFQIFRRLHSARDFSGTGIGLATVQRIIRRHGGRIWAESEPGHGARFQFTLWDQPALDQAARPPSIPD